MITSLQEIGAQLRHARIRRSKLTSPDCPCCGGHTRRSKTALSVTDRGDFLLLRCFVCDADWRDLARMLGITGGRGFHTTHLEARARDEGPFHPGMAVLAKVAVGMFEMLPADLFPAGRIGTLARVVAEHTLSARMRTARLGFAADESPFSAWWCGAVLRKLGQRISAADARLVRDLLRDTFEAGRHLGRETRNGKPFAFAIVKLSQPLLSSKLLNQIRTSNTAWSAAREQDATEVVCPVEEFLADLRPNPPPLPTVDDLIATWAVGLSGRG